MKHIKFFAFVLVAAVLLAACGGSATEPPAAAPTEAAPPPAEEGYVIGFVYPTLNNPFFVDMQAGADQAAVDFGGEVVPFSGENDVNRQVQLVEDFIAQGVDAIILQAVDTAGVVGVIEEANAAGIPIFTPGESPAGGEVVNSAIFDEVQTGRAVAEYVLTQIDAEKGAKVAMLLGIQGTETARNRQTGFEETLMKGCPACEIVAKQPADFDRAQGLTVMEGILQAQPQIDVVWAANDEMALGAIQAIKEAGRQDEMKVFGTDGVGDALAAVSSGDMAATYALPPFLQGYMITESAIKHLKGVQVCDRIEERGLLITPDNVADAPNLLRAVGEGDRYWEDCYSQ